MPVIFKFLSEVGPLILFFLVNNSGYRITLNGIVYEPIYVATAVFMVAIAIDLILSRLILKKWPIMPLVSGVFVLFFGGLTLYLHDETFIKIKPTIVNAFFGAVLGIGLYYNKLFLKIVLGGGLVLPTWTWKILTSRWCVFFFVLAVLNESIWRLGGTETWIQYKTWGAMPLTMIFTLAQAPLLQKGLEEIEREKTVEQVRA